MSTELTYQWLFEFLQRQGFEDVSPTEHERVFEHREHGILLAFSMLNDANIDRLVRDADVTSVEFQLQHRGLISGKLADLTEQVSDR